MMTLLVVNYGKQINFNYWVDFPTVLGSPDGYASLQVGANTCFYVSTTPIWPYPNGAAGDNVASQNCQRMNLNLATIDNEIERVALKNLLSKLLQDFLKYSKESLIEIIYT